MRDIVYGSAEANKERAIQQINDWRQGREDKEGRSLKWRILTPQQISALESSRLGEKLPYSPFGNILQDVLKSVKVTLIQVKTINNQEWQNVMDDPQHHSPVIKRYLTQMSSRPRSIVKDPFYSKIMSMYDKAMWVRDDVETIAPFAEPREVVTLDVDPSSRFWEIFDKEIVKQDGFEVRKFLKELGGREARDVDWVFVQGKTLRIRKAAEGEGGDESEATSNPSYTLKKLRRMTLSEWSEFYPPIDSSIFVGQTIREVSLRRSWEDQVDLNLTTFKYLGDDTRMDKERELKAREEIGIIEAACSTYENPSAAELVKTVRGSCTELRAITKAQRKNLHESMTYISRALIVDGKDDEMSLHMAASRLNEDTRSEFGIVFKVKFGTSIVDFYSLPRLYPMLFFKDKLPCETDEYFGNFEAKLDHIKANVFQQACIEYLEKEWRAEVDINVYKFTAEDGTTDFMTHYLKSDRETRWSALRY